MKLLDVNVVLPAFVKQHPDHGLVRPWFDRLLASHEPFGVPMTVWCSFLRISSSRKPFGVPLPIDDGIAYIRQVRAQPSHVATEPGPRHLDCLQQVCAEGEATGDLVPDAVLAAIALEHGAAMVSFDRDFARFPKVTWIRPT